MRRIIARIPAFVLPFILVGAGVMKFTTGHAFQYLEFQTGIDLLHPFVNNLVGVVEIGAGVLLRFRRTRKAGSVGALAIAGGAVLAHLSPWLGIAPPTGLVDGATAPWTAADFTTETSASLFVTAFVTLALAIAVAASEFRRRPTTPASESTVELDLGLDRDANAPQPA
jgi:uncharacterized membrane protein YphA (DoxX/SURF4 family)